MLHLSSKSWIFSKSPHSVYSLLDPAIEDWFRLFHHFAREGTAIHLSADSNVGMAGRRVQEMINMLEGTDYSMMPYVVKKEAFHK